MKVWLQCGVMAVAGLISAGCGGGQAPAAPAPAALTPLAPVPVPPPRTITFAVSSEGCNIPGPCRAATFWRDGEVFGSASPPLSNTGRGFNIAAINARTGAPIGAVVNFDTYLSRGDGYFLTEMIAFVNRLPAGTLLLVAVGDETGLTEGDLSCLPTPAQGSVCCTPLGAAPTEATHTLFEALGATQLRRYCYRNSYAFITIKGEGAKREQLTNGVEASLEYVLNTVDHSGA